MIGSLRRLPARFARGVALLVVLAVPVGAQEPPAGGHEPEALPHFPLAVTQRQSWSFAGPLGQYDAEQLRRGLDVFRYVCANCHSLHRAPFRTLTDPYGPALSDAEMRELAAAVPVPEYDAQGKRVTRPGRPVDAFPSPYPSDAAAAATWGAPPPDLSLMAKARAANEGFPWFILNAVSQYQEAGPDYIYNLLTGYQDPPPDAHVPPGTFYNPHFIAGPALAMPPPLADNAVDYADDSMETVDQYARDVSAFLMWAAEPHLAPRKHLGLEVMIFLVVFATLMYFSRRRLWSTVAH